MTAPWGCVAIRGALAVVVTTRAYQGVTLAEDGQFMVELIPDDGPRYEMVVLDVDDLRQFVEEMQPHHITLNVAPGEDAAAIMAAIRRTSDVAVH